MVNQVRASHILVKTEEGEIKCLMFTDTELSKAESRGQKNTEDKLEQNWISKVID